MFDVESVVLDPRTSGATIGSGEKELVNGVERYLKLREEGLD